MNLDQILKFLKTKEHAVISTCSLDNKPEAALIGFGETDELELIFGTNTSTRKYKNILENNKVAFVIGWDEDNVTVQYEGLATEIFDVEREEYCSIYHKKIPYALKFASQLGQTYFKVKPTWVRYSDLSGDDEKIFEYKF